MVASLRFASRGVGESGCRDVTGFSQLPDSPTSRIPNALVQPDRGALDGYRGSGLDVQCAARLDLDVPVRLHVDVALHLDRQVVLLRVQVNLVAVLVLDRDTAAAFGVVQRDHMAG